jgi:Zn-dependent metalloprotease/PKD repeat protein
LQPLVVWNGLIIKVPRMKLQLRILIALLFCAFNYGIFAQNQKIEFIQNNLDEGTHNPRFAILKSTSEINEADFFIWLMKTYNLSSKIEFKLYKEADDEMGFTHKKYKQYYNGVEIYSAMLIIHLQNGLVESFNGEYYKTSNSDQFTVSTSDAKAEVWKLYPTLVNSALQPDEPNLKVETKYCPLRHPNELTDIVPCYAITLDIAAPHINELVLWNANQNSLIEIQPLEIHADSNGRAATHYIGTQNIRSDFVSANNFRLRETGYRNVSTFKGALNVDYYDADNYWNNSTERIAADVHIGAELVHDYLKDYFNWDGFGNKDDTFKSITTSGSGNAFWSLSANTATFLVGTSGNVGPCAAIDVVGHEYGHGIADESGGLLYSGEACALHESFADISGHTTEYYRDSATANWYIGEDVWKATKGIRNMEDPHLFKNPKAYGGQYFPQGCHGSGGVQNRWFFLMVQGDTGINEFNYNFSLKGMGHDHALQITYRNMFYYMIPQSTFKDAFFGTIKAAKDLYGGCSEELDQTFRAWKAVNVSDPNVVTVDVSHGIAAPSQVCVGVPVDVKLSSYGDKSRKVSWLINNKDTSSAASLTYTFTKTGYYPIFLQTNTCGTIYKDSVIVAVNVLPEPNFTMPFDTACMSKDSVTIINSTKNADATIQLKYEWYIEPLDEFVYTKDLVKVFDQRFAYKVSLKAYYEGGCWDKKTKELTMVDAYKPDFEVLRNSCQGKSIKLNNLSDTSKQKLKFSWIFADNDVEVGFLPTQKTLSTSGIQNIILKAETGYKGCSDTAIRSIEIYKNPEISFDNEQFCKNGLTRLITKGIFYAPKDWSMWHVSYANPINRDTFYVQVGDSSSRTIGLTMSDTRGCNATLYKTFTVEELSANLSINEVCLGENSPLNYKIISGSAHQIVFDFGDGTTSNQELKSHTFKTPGSKIVTLTLSNAGCTVKESVTTYVKDKPVADFIADDKCFGDTIYFGNQTAHSDSISYNWLLADGNTSTLRNPKHVYSKNETKTYFVTLKTNYPNACRDSISKPLTITETPNCGFTVTRDPDNGNNSFVFTPNTINQKSYVWLFGDGKQSTDAVAKHQYANNGVYNVSLKIISQADCSCEGANNLNATYLGVDQFNVKPNVYPNPFNKILQVDVQIESKYSFIDITGKIIETGNLHSGHNSIATNHLSNGTYWLEIKTQNAVHRSKVVKMD